MRKFRKTERQSIQVYRHNYAMGVQKAYKKWGGQLVQADVPYQAFFINTGELFKGGYIIQTPEGILPLRTRAPASAVKALLPYHEKVYVYAQGAQTQKKTLYKKAIGKMSLLSQNIKGEAVQGETKCVAMGINDNPVKNHATFQVVIGETAIPFNNMTMAWQFLSGIQSIYNKGYIIQNQAQDKPSEQLKTVSFDL